MFQHNNKAILKSHAKINISLKILNKREDGYHDLEMVILPLEMHDIVEITKDPHLSDTFTTCDDIGLSNSKHNLCTKAVEAMRSKFGFKDNFLIHIHKEIPFAAGLGGGSSNAAVVIKGINDILNLKATKEELIEVGLSVGADVPFFIDCLPAKATGLGEKLEAISLKKHYFCLLVKPETGLSTKSVFAIADKYEKRPIDTGKIIESLKNGSDDFAEYIGNDLESPAEVILPEVKTILDGFKQDGLRLSGMSGSGSACFALSTNQTLLKELAKKYQAKGYVVRLTRTL